MKIETPQILWHNTLKGNSQSENGKASPILSCSLLDSNASAIAVGGRNKGTKDGEKDTKQHSRFAVLATAGNTEVNLWRLRLTDDTTRLASRPDSGESQNCSRILVKPLMQPINVPPAARKINTSSGDNNPSPNEIFPREHTHIEHLLTLSRGTSERNMNAVKFSPDGRHLVAAGDGGTVVVWSIPSSDYSTSQPESIPTESTFRYWSSCLEKETDLHLKMLFNQSDDVMDIAWSSDSKRFVVCSLDHTMAIYELSIKRTNTANGTTEFKPEWQSVHRSSKDHTHYIQGVAYDPKGVYVASQGSDRAVKVYSRKNIKEKEIKEAVDALSKITSQQPNKISSGPDGNEGKESEKTDDYQNNNALIQGRVLPELLSNTKFDLQSKTKTIKFLNTCPKPTNPGSSIQSESDSINGHTVKEATKDTSINPKRHHMFADEVTVGSFFRRLAFTVDGAFLVVPTALWQGSENAEKAVNSTSARPESPTTVIPSRDEKSSESSFATYLFARHHFDHPYKVLTGIDKPSVVVRPNPLLFQLPATASKCENKKDVLPYRSVFAVLTIDTVLIYDTHHNHPLCIARGLHYSGLTDATWSQDGTTLFVTSSDGYISILSFAKGELGEQYHAPVQFTSPSEIGVDKVDPVKANVSCATLERQNESEGQIPSKMIVNTLVPKKKKRVAPILIAGTEGSLSESQNATNSKRVSSLDNPSADVDHNTPSPENEDAGVKTDAVEPVKEDISGSAGCLSMEKQSGEKEGEDVTNPVKKKRRIQPTLVSC